MDKKKKVVICASVSFGEDILEWKNKLELSGFEVIKYPIKITSENFLTRYKNEFTEHYEAITKADAIFVLNPEKNGIAGYIGAGVFAEISFAIGLNIALDKKIEIWYLNHIQDDSLPYSGELKLWEELGWVKLFNV